MDLIRKIAIAVVMMIPAFIFSGLVWQVVESWLLVFMTLAAVIVLYVMIISGRIVKKRQTA